MSSFNQVILIGRLGQDPDVKAFDNGDMVANLSIATSETWKDKQTGEKREATQWHRVVLKTSGLARVAREWLKKGALVQVCGQLVYREWTDRDGGKRYVAEVIVGPRGSMQMLGAASQNAGPRNADYVEQERKAAASPPDDMDDDVPF